MDTNTFDSAPVSAKKRRYKNQPAAKSHTHTVIMCVPHTGYEFCLGEIVDRELALTDTQAGVYDLDHIEDWQKTGGVLTITMDQVNTQNNQLICSAVADSGRRVYIHCGSDRLWCEIATVEFATGESLKNHSTADSVHINSQMVVHAVHLHRVAYAAIFARWFELFPGETHCVTRSFASKQLPWPHEILANLDDDAYRNRGGASGWRDMVFMGGRDAHVNLHPQTMSEYFQRIPNYAK